MVSGGCSLCVAARLHTDSQSRRAPKRRGENIAVMLSPIEQEFDIGPYRPGEEAAILDCFRACFGLDVALPVWRRLFLDNPGGTAILILARKKEVVVGQAAILPKPIAAFGHHGLAGHSIWLMTRPEWQRRGLSRTLAAFAENIARERGLLAIYGFANEQSHHGIDKYQGRRPLKPFPLMLRPLSPIHAGVSLVRKRLGVEGEPPPVLDAPSWSKPAFDDRHTALFQQAQRLPSIAVIRDRAYLSWRYPSVADSLYRQHDSVTASGLEGTVIVRATQQAGLCVIAVMEWLWTSEASAGKLMREVVQLARSARAHAVVALAMPGTAQRQRLHRLGFVGIPNMFLPEPTTLMVCRLGPSPDEALWLMPSNWYLTFGDGTLII